MISTDLVGVSVLFGRRGKPMTTAMIRAIGLRRNLEWLMLVEEHKTGALVEIDLSDYKVVVVPEGQEEQGGIRE